MLRLADSDETNTTLQLSGKEKLVDLANKGLNLIGIGAERCLLIYGVTGRPRIVSPGIQAGAVDQPQAQGLSGEFLHRSHLAKVQIFNTLPAQHTLGSRLCT